MKKKGVIILKKWNNPELKSLSIGNTNEGSAPFYFKPGAGIPCICKLFGKAEYGNACPYPLNPCENTEKKKILCGTVEYWICKYAEPVIDTPTTSA